MAYTSRSINVFSGWWKMRWPLPNVNYFRRIYELMNVVGCVRRLRPLYTSRSAVGA